LGDALDWARERGLSAHDDLSYLREFEHLPLARVLLAQYKSERQSASFLRSGDYWSASCRQRKQASAHPYQAHLQQTQRHQSPGGRQPGRRTGLALAAPSPGPRRPPHRSARYPTIAGPPWPGAYRRNLCPYRNPHVAPSAITTSGDAISPHSLLYCDRRREQTPRPGASSILGKMHEAQNE
jgi:hypothetical protein